HNAKETCVNAEKDNNGIEPVGSAKKKPKLDLPTDLDIIDWDLDDAFELAVARAEEMESTRPLRLDLTQWQRCEVTSVVHTPRDQNSEIEVKKSTSDGDPQTAVCKLLPPWNQTRLAAGDTVSILAKWDPSTESYVVDKEQGYCVAHPDLLISGTTVTGSLFCIRKAVLQQRFGSLESGNSVMLVGTFVHELLQTVLRQNLSSRDEIYTELQKLLASSSLAQSLYAARMSHEEMAFELDKFVNPIASFVAQYVMGVGPASLPPDNYTGRIRHVLDIEENLWVPQLGLKGKVDVAVSVKSAQGKRADIPLELKTGRAIFSMEHKGQLLLYQIMLTALGKETNSGLLLYLKENLMQEIQSGRNEQRDLVMRRNELAHWLTRDIATPPDQNEELVELEDMALPEPICHRNACSKCTYSTICASFAQRDDSLELSQSHPFKVLMPTVLEHLNVTHLKYVHHWIGLLNLEEQHNRQSSQLKSLWTVDPLKRQKQGRAICDLKLVEGKKVAFEEGRYLQSLEIGGEVDANRNITLRFDIGEYVVISCTSRIAIASGFIVSLDARRVDLRLERDLSLLYAKESFVMDKHESQTFSTFNFSNLALLLTDDARTGVLRDIIVNKRPKNSNDTMDSMMEAEHMMRHLNIEQKLAIRRCVVMPNYMLIKGLPGTGKTETLVVLVKVLHHLGKSVLITAQTHSAVDNLLMRLLPSGLPMLRLGSTSRIHSELKEIGEEWLTKDCKTVDELERVLNKPMIVGVTCLGAGHALLQRRRFNYCIVDEATQVMQPTVIRPLMSCDRFVLVGDPEQLPPIVRSKEARRRGADETLFKRLDMGGCTYVLSLQYRMNATITKLANKLTYGGKLKCGSTEVSEAKLQLETKPQVKAAKWVTLALHCHLDQAVRLIDTGDCLDRCQELIEASTQLATTCSAIEESFSEEKEQQTEQRVGGGSRNVSKYTNYCEAGVVMKLLAYLLRCGFKASEIGVIAPYRAQVELLKKLTFKMDPQLEINTVDTFQGRDKSLIIYSCTKTGHGNNDTDRSREAEILEDKRRLTVAITRAKHKLIILGDVQCLEQYGPFKAMFENIPSMRRLKLEDEKLDFSWERIRRHLVTLMNA
ncbi:DNA replication ATP-dependent helicase/nuclease DNA2, partial [Drosophila ficusphila]|uniref:DNA replication ATP-dependent helicase/nuclease DNA2 n=1 Tax=Drosophila ficusphila TaxID=30025 RepID=UPI001C89B17D